jgi:hypothetical protein
MSTDRDTTRIVRSWLEEGATALPDRVLDAVLDQVPATPQRRAWWPARRSAAMNNAYKFLIAAAAVVVIAVAGINLLPRNGVVGGSGPSASPSPTPSPVLTSDGPLEAGTTYLINEQSRVLGPRWVVIAVPATGWSSTDNIVNKNPPAGSGLPLAKLSTWTVGNLKADPCHWKAGALDPPVGPTVGDLAAALVVQVGPTVATSTDVTLGGYRGKKIEYSAPSDLDLTSCDEGLYSRWQPAGSNDWGGWVAAAGQRNAVYIIDVDGQRLVIDTFSLPDASTADLAELDQIIASIRFESTAPSPSAASPSP